jgi:catechol 2,3-dioxygenase-like lactoylglutathione lyase family enzyme
MIGYRRAANRGGPDGQGDPQHDPRARRGALGRVLRRGLRPEGRDRLEFEGFTLIYLRNDAADFEVELTVNQGRTEPYELGDGYGHLAFVVDDLEAEHARLAAAGLGPGKLAALERDGARARRSAPRTPAPWSTSGRSSASAGSSRSSTSTGPTRWIGSLSTCRS